MLQQQFESLEQRTIDALDSLRHYRARLQELETRLAESEAQRLELTEENRELDEQNRELEEDNARLRERLRSGEPAPAFPAPPRRAQGLAALIGQRLEAPPAAEAPPPAAEAPVPTPAPPPPAATRDTPQGQLAIEQAPSADALLKQWYQRYPNAFFKGHTRPLKVGIHQDLAAHEPWPEKLLRRALAGYVNLPRYLKAVREVPNVSTLKASLTATSMPRPPNMPSANWNGCKKPSANAEKNSLTAPGAATPGATRLTIKALHPPQSRKPIPSAR